MRRIACVCLLLLCLAGCGRSDPVFVWAVDTLPTNLDPQVVSSPIDRMAVRQLYRGLFVSDSSGQPQPDLCSQLEMGSDSHTCTITLKDAVYWQDGQAVTAQDFVYGLARALDPATGCPDREALSSCINDAYSLNDSTLVLSFAADCTEEQVKELLCLPAALPCRRSFFEKCAGQYGLTRKTTLGNGAFSVASWGYTTLLLKRQQGEGVGWVRLATPDSQQEATAQLIRGADGNGETVGTICCALLMNSRNELLSQPSLRRSIAGAAVEAPLPNAFTAPCGLIPGSNLSRLDYGSPQEQLWEGLGQLGLNSVHGLTILIPDENDFLALANAVNQQLQTQLGIFCRVQRIPLSELTDRIASGDYSLALLPCLPQQSDPSDYLTALAACTGLSAVYDDQDRLMEEITLVPLGSQCLTLETSLPITGLEIDPFTFSPDFSRLAYPNKRSLFSRT